MVSVEVVYCLRQEMCIAIEPMVTMGKREIGLLPDRWSIVTRDRRPAAHFEHTIAIRAGKADILSSFEEVEHLEGQNFLISIWQSKLQ